MTFEYQTITPSTSASPSAPQASAAPTEPTRAIRKSSRSVGDYVPDGIALALFVCAVRSGRGAAGGKKPDHPTTLRS